MAALRGAQEAAERAGFRGCSRRGPTSPSPTRSRGACLLRAALPACWRPGPGQAAWPGSADRGADHREPDRLPDLGRALGRGSRDPGRGTRPGPSAAGTLRAPRDPCPYRRGPGRRRNGRTGAGRTALAAGRRAGGEPAPALARPARDRQPAGQGRPRGRPGCRRRAALIRDRPADPRYLWPLLAAAMCACAEASAVSLPPHAAGGVRAPAGRECRVSGREPAGAAARLGRPADLACRLGARVLCLSRSARWPGGPASTCPPCPGSTGTSSPAEPRRSGSPSANSKCCAWWPPACGNRDIAAEALHLAQDGQRARVQHPRQARRQLARRGRSDGLPPAPSGRQLTAVR